MEIEIEHKTKNGSIGRTTYETEGDPKEGSRGIVHKIKGENTVIKMLKSDFVDKEEIKNDFIEQIKKQYDLTGEGTGVEGCLVKIIEYGFTKKINQIGNKVPYCVMEFMPENLYQILSEIFKDNKKEIKKEDCSYLAFSYQTILNLLNILDKLNNRSPPIHHGDLTFSNIFYDNEGKVKLSDFWGGTGIAPTTLLKKQEGIFTLQDMMSLVPPDSEISEFYDLYSLGRIAITLLDLERPCFTPNKKIENKRVPEEIKNLIYGLSQMHLEDRKDFVENQSQKIIEQLKKGISGTKSFSVKEKNNYYYVLTPSESYQEDLNEIIENIKKRTIKGNDLAEVKYVYEKKIKEVDGIIGEREKIENITKKHLKEILILCNEEVAKNSNSISQKDKELAPIIQEKENLEKKIKEIEGRIKRIESEKKLFKFKKDEVGEIIAEINKFKIDKNLENG